jgi:hypothetical protein
VSYDDGTNWKTVELVSMGHDEWLAILNHPAGGYVSLRANATFADGGTVEYKVMRAYRLQTH